MATVLTQKRYLVGKLLAENKILTTRMVFQQEDGTFTHKPFEAETHSTIWISGTIIAIKQEELDDFLLSDLEMMANRGDSLDQINDYLKSSNLYATQRKDIAALIQL